jgi:hypothetical protein
MAKGQPAKAGQSRPLTKGGRVGVVEYEIEKYAKCRRLKLSKDSFVNAA